MPVVPSKFQPLFWAKSSFVSTVYSGLIRHVEGVSQHRERLELSDGDFMDLDWSFASGGSQSVVILLHGLEGDAQRPYITGTAKHFNANGIDACSVNFRGCSGEPNRLFRSYHSGASDDLDAVVNHLLAQGKYTRLYIKGISLGANMALKYAGEGRSLPKELQSIIAISAPCHLYGACKALESFGNKPYAIRFLKHLKQKLQPKLRQFPEDISESDYRAIGSIFEFDEVYTAKAHGFQGALDYYTQCSSLQYLKDIRIPTLILNAKNDSFLSEACYPFQAAAENPHLYLEVPKYGGHVGFIAKGNVYYNENRALRFVQERNYA